MHRSALRQTRRHVFGKPKPTDDRGARFCPRLGFRRCSSSRRFILFCGRLLRAWIGGARLFRLGVPQSVASPTTELWSERIIDISELVGRGCERANCQTRIHHIRGGVVILRARNAQVFSSQPAFLDTDSTIAAGHNAARSETASVTHMSSKS
jgi:hypothetical protein